MCISTNAYQQSVSSVSSVVVFIYAKVEFLILNCQLSRLFVSLSKKVSLSKLSIINYPSLCLYVKKSLFVKNINYQLSRLFVSMSKKVSLSKISIINYPVSLSLCQKPFSMSTNKNRTRLTTRPAIV